MILQNFNYNYWLEVGSYKGELWFIDYEVLEIYVLLRPQRKIIVQICFGRSWEFEIILFLTVPTMVVHLHLG